MHAGAIANTLQHYLTNLINNATSITTPTAFDRETLRILVSPLLQYLSNSIDWLVCDLVQFPVYYNYVAAFTTIVLSLQLVQTATTFFYSYLFRTVYIKSDAEDALDTLMRFQPNKPLMVGEFWTGWFDHWGEKHHVLALSNFTETLDAILARGASVNFYMFHGGTNFGFMNGANLNRSGDNLLKYFVSLDFFV